MSERTCQLVAAILYSGMVAERGGHFAVSENWQKILLGNFCPKTLNFWLKTHLGEN